MIQLIKRLLPTPARILIQLVRLAVSYFYDFERYLKWSATVDPRGSRLKHQGRIIVGYHSLEKGLSLNDPRIGFGAEKVTDLVSLLTDYEAQYGLDRIGVVALNALYAYYDFNLKHGVDDKDLYGKLLELRERVPPELDNEKQGGVRSTSRQRIQEAARVDFRRFVNLRFSIRNFAPGDIDIELIQDAVSMALKTPSVCNRQTWKVYVFDGDDMKEKALSYQNGNKGFGDSASKILLITSELGYFRYHGERNQAFVDGGMFAMSLVYALHSLGVGSCCLNLCNDYETEQALRKATEISDSEVLLMMIAVGNIPDFLHVAQSPRRDIQEILIVRNSTPAS